MEFDLMTGPGTWVEIANLARRLQEHDFSGMLFTETSEVPWMKIAVAAASAPRLHFCTGIAGAFTRSPMVSAAVAWELAGNTGGRFRLGLGTQARAHVVDRYSSQFSEPAARLHDYVSAVRACFRAFRGEEPLSHEGRFFKLSYLPPRWTPRPHDYGDVPVDIAAVGPIMARVAGEAADGVHVHPFHSTHYLSQRLLPDITAGAAAAGRDPNSIDLIVPVLTAPGDTPEDREAAVGRARSQIAFYGSAEHYAHQFDDLGFDGTTARLTSLMQSGDVDAMADTITDEMLEHFAIVCRWDELADRLLDRYGGTASRLVVYLADDSIRRDASALARWGEVARAMRATQRPDR